MRAILSEGISTSEGSTEPRRKGTADSIQCKGARRIAATAQAATRDVPFVFVVPLRICVKTIYLPKGRTHSRRLAAYHATEGERHVAEGPEFSHWDRLWTPLIRGIGVDRRGRIGCVQNCRIGEKIVDIRTAVDTCFRLYELPIPNTHI